MCIRDSLYHRIGVVVVRVPALREHAQDIVEMKRLKIKEEMQEIVENESYDGYKEFAEDVYKRQIYESATIDPQSLMASFLRATWIALWNEIAEMSSVLER